MAKQAHVLVIPASVQGHVTPLMELSQSLAIRGIKVTFVTEESVKERIMAAFPNKGSMHSLIHLASIPDGAKFGDDTKEIDAARKVMPGYLENLIRKINEESDNNNKINCFIASAALKWAMEVAEKMGIKRAVFSTTSVGVLALLLHIPKLIQAGIINESGTALKNEMIQLSPNAPAISTADLLWNCTEDPTMQSIIFKASLDTKNVAKLCDWILCNSFYELEPWFCDMIPNSLPVGPLHSNVIPGGTIGSLWHEDSTCISWLDQQPARSVIYVAFGSFATFSQSQFDELAAGLQLASEPFLWVIRTDFMKGSNRNQDEFRDGVAHCGKIVSWAPQQKVLDHPSVACFISHCGWNSIMDGLSMGVPFLCWPQFADQFFNKHLICDVWRVGLDLEVDENNIVSRDEIKSKVKKLLGDESIKAKASELKEMSWKAGNLGGTSFSNLEDFVEQIKCLIECLEVYSSELRKLALKILDQMAKALKIEAEEMRELFSDGVQSMRMNYYPPCPQPEMAIGFTPHSDADALTILLQLNETEGLQIRKQGKWVPVKPLPNALVVNIGDIMEIVSNGIYRSIEQRATVNSMKERLSIATFYSTKLNAALGPATSLIGPHNPAIFRRVPVEKYFKDFFTRKLDGKSYLDFMRIENEERNTS